MKVIFITYINRSGSTFLVNQLSKHPKLLVLPEGEILVRKLLYRPSEFPVKNIVNILQSDHKLKHWNWDITGLGDHLQGLTNAELFFHLLELYREHNAPDCEIVVFKAWELIFTLGKIPSTLIHKYQLQYFGLVRDARAVVASQRYTTYRKKPLETNTLRSVWKWKSFAKKCRSQEDKISILKYETMILDYHSFFSSFFDALGLTWDQSIKTRTGTVMEHLPVDQKSMHKSIDEVPNKAFIDQWKVTLPPSEIKIIQSLAGKELSDFNYSLSPVEASGFQLFIRWIKYLSGYAIIKVINPSN